jgi:hypothetical protein
VLVFPDTIRNPDADLTVRRALPVKETDQHAFGVDDDGQCLSWPRPLYCTAGMLLCIRQQQSVVMSGNA